MLYAYSLSNHLIHGYIWLPSDFGYVNPCQIFSDEGTHWDCYFLETPLLPKILVWDTLGDTEST